MNDKELPEYKCWDCGFEWNYLSWIGCPKCAEKSRLLIHNSERLRAIRESQPKVTLKEAQDQAKRVMDAAPKPITHRDGGEEMRLHQCCICKTIDRWTGGWSSYGSLLLEENRGDLIARLCSDECAEEFKRRMKSGEIVPAAAKAKGRPYSVKITEPIGYEPHPSQRELLEQYNIRALRSATPPNEQRRDL